VEDEDDEDEDEDEKGAPHELKEGIIEYAAFDDDDDDDIPFKIEKSEAEGVPGI
jgi:hypothetical protein